jgi:hypothetical protein
VTTELLDWFSDHLNDRRQRVVVDGVVSQWASVTYGAPQGIIRGPLHFVIFINDVPEVIKEEPLSWFFAYETKVYGNITSGSDCDRLQQALTNLDLWSQDNNIKFDLSYLCIIWDAKENSNILWLLPRVRSKETLLSVEEEKDLGRHPVQQTYHGLTHKRGGI